MIILGVETSCDETALSLIDATGDISAPQFKVLATSLFSQAKLHAEYGGVFPTLAKREHNKNLIPLFKVLVEKVGGEKPVILSDIQKKEIEEILAREGELKDTFIKEIETINCPHIDRIVVTSGPGLEPALWVGISFTKALSIAWNIPVFPTNHMEGHILSPLLTDASAVTFPALALLISGGHTELVKVSSWGEYKVIGATKDDAVGEAFDKVARILGLPYPGGPEISKLASISRKRGDKLSFTFPRPMIHSGDFDFSFAGLKTAVLYHTQKFPPTTDTKKENIAREFEDAVTETLIKKTQKALEEIGSSTLIIGGGVIANTDIRKAFEELSQSLGFHLLIPSTDLATDNAVMIAMAGYIDSFKKTESNANFRAEGNLSF